MIMQNLDEEAYSQMVQEAKEPSNQEITQSEANFQTGMSELDEIEQQALLAAGMDVAPEEEDMFCELAW